MQYINEDVTGTKYAVDLIMSGIAFVPPFGWVFSSAYFLLDSVGVWTSLDGPFDPVLVRNLKEQNGKDNLQLNSGVGF